MFIRKGFVVYFKQKAFMKQMLRLKQNFLF